MNNIKTGRTKHKFVCKDLFMALKLAALWPDTHRPYHHKKACDLVLNILQDLQPDEIVLLGDYADFYSVSSYAKDPRILQHLKAEVDDVNQGLDKFDKLFPNAKKVFIEGNHCHRLEKYLINNCPALFGLTSCRNLFKIDQRPKWRFVDYGPSQAYQVLGSYLTARHEPLAASAKATASRALCSLTYGHIHRIEESHLVGLDGTNHVCFSVGWLGDKRNDLVFDYVKGYHQWQLGFGLVWVDPETRFFYHQKIPLIEVNNKVTCVVNGRLYSS